MVKRILFLSPPSYRFLMTERSRFSWFQFPQFFHVGDVCTGGHVFHYICSVMVKWVNLLYQFIIKTIANKEMQR
jgi:hypothetical protein